MAPIIQDTFSISMVALRGLVVFPDMTLHFDIGRKKSISAVKNAMLSKQRIFLLTQTDLSEEVNGVNDLYRMGVVCDIKQLVRLPSGEYYRVVVEGKYRARLIDLVETTPHFVAEVRAVTTREPRNTTILEADALMRYAKSLFEDYAMLNQKLPQDIALGVASLHSAGKLADYIAANSPLEYTDKQTILSELNAYKRLEKLCLILAKETQMLEAAAVIDERVQEQMDENQREYYLREQMKAIAQELGDGESSVNEAQKYREKILALHLDKESEDKLLQECDRLAHMQPTSPESTVSRTYLDTVLGLPFGKYTKDNLNLENARKILDHDHYGLDAVKDRIIEFLAVRKLSPDIKGQIICLVGPPGVGKTSIAKSLARAINRKYTRISLGGVGDEAEIRGHRKTYIGSMPGSIIAAVQRAGSANPLILLDEIDKLSKDYKGDPASALLEALDPEQNNTFRDHYIEIPFDLSRVLFITTANDTSTIPAPLLDRMEVIELYSYTAEEKFQIAKRHLVKKQLKASGIKPAQLRITDDALRLMIDGYTREAGVRKLERTIAKTIRKEAVKIASGYDKKITVRASDLEELLGPRKFKPENLSGKDEVGAVNGLAWTSVGGELLKVEAAVMDGTGKLELTGSLGDVMKESAKAAYTYVRAHATEWNIDPTFYKNKDIHIHFPEGAVPKDGPSAGVTVTTALVSALSDTPVRADVAMTGEVTVTGRVLPIGGLREKTMAAYKNGMHTVLLPDENLPDLREADKTVLENLDFVPVSDVREVLNNALVRTEKTETAEQKPVPLMTSNRKGKPGICRQN